jgi:hypothetical protein
MYKGFCEDLEYVFGLLFKPFEGCCDNEDSEDDEDDRKCGMACDEMPCFRENEDKDDEEEDKKEAGAGGILGTGPIQDILKCLFDASDVDYDYED